MSFNPDTIRFFFHQDEVGSASGTFWPLWGGWATARHVVEAMRGHLPPWAEGPLFEAPGFVDAALIGANRPTQRPRDPKVGERVKIYGWPEGGDALSVRTGTILAKRGANGSFGYEEPSFIVAFDEPPLVLRPGAYDASTYHLPVVTGMSGGAVIDAAGEPLGILITRTSAFDSDRNGHLEQTCDFQALSDVFDYIWAGKGRGLS